MMIQQLPFNLEAAGETLPSSVDTTLRLFTGPREATPSIGFSNIRKEPKLNIPSDFLGLAIDPSRNYHHETETHDEFLDAKVDNVFGSGRKKRSMNRRRPRITALCPTPLRSYHPSYGFRVYDDVVLGGTTNDAASTTASTSSSSKRPNQETSMNDPPKKRARRAKADYHQDDDETAAPEISCSRLLAIIGPEARPVFLYRKKLVEWDTDKGQNRLLVNRMGKLMGFLTEEERRAVNNADRENPGIEVVAIDSMEREFDMRCKIWGSIGKVVIKTSWHKMVLANKATVGHQVLLWGYRKDDGMFRLAVEFRHQ